MNVGWFRVNRKLFDNEIWFYEPFTKGQAWLDLFGNANHKEGSFEIRGNLITIQRGQIGWSEVTMAKRWKWSRNKVRRYLKWLETIQQIKIGDTADDTLENKDNNKGFVPKVTLQQDDTKSTPKRYSRRYSKNNRYLTTIITICNYDKYQNDTADDTAKRQQTIQQTIHKQERIKNDKEIIKKGTYTNLTDLTDKDFIEIATKYDCPIAFVRSKYDDMVLWVGEKTGRDKGRNWKLTLMNWVKRDGLKIKQDYAKQNSEVAL